MRLKRNPIEGRGVINRAFEPIGEIVFEKKRPLFGWPGWPHIRHFVALWMLVSAEFACVFVGGDVVTAHRALRLHLFLPIELLIPLIPPTVLVYMSIYLIWLPAPFILRTRAEINQMAIALAKVILIAGVGFIVLPAELGFPPLAVDLARIDPASAERWGDLLELADRVSLEFNLIPSLHIALFLTSAGVYFLRAPMSGRVALCVWTLAVAASTVLTHRHQLADVFAGIALGFWGIRTAAVKAHP